MSLVLSFISLSLFQSIKLVGCLGTIDDVTTIHFPFSSSSAALLGYPEPQAPLHKSLQSTKAQNKNIFKVYWSVLKRNIFKVYWSVLKRNIFKVYWSNMSSKETFSKFIGVSSKETFSKFIGVSSKETFSKFIGVSSKETFSKFIGVS